jgi:hypothetical protein
MRVISLPNSGHTSDSSGFFLITHYITKILLLVTCVMLGALMTGCTTLQPMADNAEFLRTELRSGEAVKPGDKVRVVTRDGLSRLLIVTALDKNTLKGHPEGVETPSGVVSLPIDDIVFMEGKKISIGKTAAYTSGFTVGTVLAAGIALLILLATW